MDKYCTLYNCDCEEAEFQCQSENEAAKEQDTICCQECNFYVKVE